MLDKSKELAVSLDLLNDKLHFEGSVKGNELISIDYIPPFGDNLGYTSLELLLLSLSSCFGSSILVLLRKMTKNIIGLDIVATGIRKEEHPTGFRSITIILNLKSRNVSSEDLDGVIKLAKESYCPVWSMLKGNVEIEVRYNIIS
jgi:putative redox protein